MIATSPSVEGGRQTYVLEPGVDLRDRHDPGDRRRDRGSARTSGELLRLRAVETAEA
jgi:hypothetical protein